MIPGSLHCTHHIKICVTMPSKILATTSHVKFPSKKIYMDRKFSISMMKFIVFATFGPALSSSGPQRHFPKHLTREKVRGSFL